MRYPELDVVGANEACFGTHLADQQAAIGGFLPIFWRAPFDPIHATIDLELVVEWISNQLPRTAGENVGLAVLHYRTDMVGAFNRSEWVSNSDGCIISRGVTSCAGMTARHVLLVQTKVSFLTGGRSNRFLQLERLRRTLNGKKPMSESLLLSPEHSVFVSQPGQPG